MHRGAGGWLWRGLLFAAVVLPGLPGTVAAAAWRIDFNGTAGDTLVSSNFTGWTVSSTSRTQVFAGVDGDPGEGDLTVALRGTGGTAWSTYQRNMNSGSFTNLYRDGVQYNGSALEIHLEGLAPGGSCKVRLWYFDDEFSIAGVQAYSQRTGSGDAPLGALTNVAAANLAAGQGGLPATLRDARYLLEATLPADGAGSVDVVVTPAAGNAKVNALEVETVEAPPGIAYSGSIFGEAASNDGSISNSLLLQLDRGSWAGSDGDDFLSGGRALAGSVPPGLTPHLVRLSSNQLAFTLSGHAFAHGTADSRMDLALELLDAAFDGVVASSVTGASRSDLQVAFLDGSSEAPSARVALAWSSVPGCTYAIEFASRPDGNFTPQATGVPADLALTGWTAAVPHAVVTPVIFRIRMDSP